MPKLTDLFSIGAFALFSFLAYSQVHAAKPLKVYLLVGQSNMQGHAKISTFDHIGMDPKTAPILRKMRDENGKVRVCKDVWISAITQGEVEFTGNLTAGYGAREDRIGPEFTFGIYMQELVKEPILIIKTAWGGKSLHTDFRSPSGGPFVFSDAHKQRLTQRGQWPKAAEETKMKTGHYYRLMMSHIQKVLKDIKSVYPDYQGQGYQLAGFVWFQGWNDMVSNTVYPLRTQPGGYDLYRELMAHFIRDVRKDLGALKMPFVIGVMGVAGVNSTHPAHIQFRKAMAAPAELPEFKGNVTAVHTANYWDDQLHELRKRGGKLSALQRKMSKAKASRNEIKAAVEKLRMELYSEKDLQILKGSSNADYHYMGSGKVMAQIGKAFAEAIHEMSE